MKNGDHKLIIGDLHEPVTHPAYLDFCNGIRNKHKCNDIIFIGDVVDWHAISFHAKHPECPGTKDEYNTAKKALAKWVKAFPNARVCIGNHDERPERLANTVSIPKFMLKSYSELWETGKWMWDYHFLDRINKHNKIYFMHGTGQKGLHPAWNVSNKLSMSVVMGHCHSRAGIKWRANTDERFFAMDAGCGIDVKAYQFVYQENIVEKPILGCGVIVDGIPYYEIMPINDNEAYGKR